MTKKKIVDVKQKGLNNTTYTSTIIFSLRQNSFLPRVTLFAFLCVVSACTGLRKIPEGQYLLTKNDLTLRDKSVIYNYKKVSKALKEELKPEPNGKLLWMRPRLAFFNAFSEPKKEKGFKHWLKYKVGKAPVFLDEKTSANLNLAFENRLYHQGYFNATSKYKIVRKSKTAEQQYLVDANRPYKIDTLILPKMIDDLSTKISALSESSLIQKHDVYSLEVIKKERARIDEALKDQGYYNFDQDYLLFLADSIQGDHKVKLKLTIKEDAPASAGNIYKINTITVAEDFRLENYLPDTTIMEDFKIVSSTEYMKPKMFLNSIINEKGDLYSKTKHNNSLRQLMGLRSYKFVNARYNVSESGSNELDVSYLLTPSQRMSLSAEVNAVSKSNNFVGPGLILSYKSRNTFRGAELFSLNLRGRFEQQVSGEKQGDTAYEISADASLDVPKLMPFGLRKLNKPYLPNANITIGTGIYARVSLYRFNTFNSGLEYSWKKNNFLTHLFKPIDLSVTDLVDASDEFKEFLLLNPSIRQSFEEQFILGFSYNFIINKLQDTNKRMYYLNAGIDPSGNLIALFHNLFSSSEDPDKKITMFGTPISQFFRIRTDFRYYFKVGKEARLATRLYAGFGVPYGNSDVMPYVKQFYAGGTNSLRAFRARSIGPGSYVPPDSLNNVLVDQTGEIKLETNIEYRFPIAGFLKGALFTDIGNIWLVNEDTLRPGGKFELEKFHKELAVGLGFGLRVDVNLVVLRFDWAFPVRKPWLPENERWVFDQIDFFSRKWRKENILWNISIGYPF